jgi:hypothetical protein
VWRTMTDKHGELAVLLFVLLKISRNHRFRQR